MSSELELIFAGNRPILPEFKNYPPLRVVDGGNGMRVIGNNDKAVPKFNLVQIGDLELTEPEYLIDGLIETETLSLIFGDPGCGKSFLALDVAMCIAAGVPFHGHDVRQGAVVYMAGEGHNGITRRLKALSKQHGIDPSLLPMFVSERAANFLDANTMEAVGLACDSVRAAHGEPALIVVDTVARSFGSGDENSTQDMNNFICAVDDLKARYPGATIILVHHTGHGDKQRARGAMALKGALDAEYRIEKSSDVVSMTTTKMKDADEPDPIAFKLVDVSLGITKRGEPYGSAVLELTDAPVKKGGDKLTANQKLAISTCRTAAENHAVMDDGAFRGVHLDHWREEFMAKHTGDKPDTKRKSFNRAREALVASGMMDVNNDMYILKGIQGADLHDKLINGTAGR